MPVRELGRAPRERAFSLVEIVVVLVILLILGGIGTSMLRSASSGESAPVTAATGGIVWRGVMAWRTEEGKGLLPPANLLLASNGRGGFGGGLVDGAGNRIIRDWPEVGKGTPVKIYAGTTTTAPTTSTTWANGLVYRASADRRTGWVAAYGPAGRLAFRRSISTGANPEAPIG